VIVTPTATVHQAYRFALDPTPRQQAALASHVGGARFAFNWGLALVKERLDARAAGQQVAVPWTLSALRREWNRAKDQVAPWWMENSKEAYSSGLDALGRGLRNWAESKAGRRAGATVGFPRFRNKGRGRQACRFTTGTIRVSPDRHHVQLPRLGRIKTHESTRKLARHLERGSGRILAATITRTADRWYVAFTCQLTRHLPTSNRQRSRVGVDVGIRHLAVLSTGELVDNPRPLERVQRTRRRLQRRWSRQQRARKAAARARPGRRQEQTRRRIARVEARAANLRRDALHQLTSRLAREHGTVVVERLNVAGMVRNRRLARAIADSGMGQIRRLLAYKTAWAGARLVEADRFYPSSKTCSRCGVAKAKLPLSQRVFSCEVCGLELDRDRNAARNLARLAEHVEDVAGSGPETRNARGADVRPGLAGLTAAKREAGTRGHLGETGTVGAQAPAARIADKHRQSW
jgi:putative transposase